MDEYLVTVRYHQWSNIPTLKRLKSLIQQTDASDLPRQSSGFVFSVYWISSNGVHICVVFGAPERRHQSRTLNYGSLIWVSDFQQSIQAWLNSNGLFMVSWYECRNTLMHLFVRHHWRCHCTEAWYPCLLSDSGSRLLADVHSFFPPLSQPPMLWHFIYILVSRVQDREACCKNNIQIVPADRKVHSEQEREMSSAGAYEAESMKPSRLPRCLWSCKRFSWSINIMFFFVFLLFFVKTQSLTSVKHQVADDS